MQSFFSESVAEEISKLKGELVHLCGDTVKVDDAEARLYLCIEMCDGILLQLRNAEIKEQLKFGMMFSVQLLTFGIN